MVTEFEFDLHQVGTTALVVDLFYPPQEAPAALRRWRDLIPQAPPQATLTAWVGTTGQTPSLPPEVWNRPMASVGFVWVGDPDQGRGLLAALRNGASPLAERVQELSYLELRQMDDAGHRHGMRRYWKGHFLRELDDTAIEAFLARGDGDAEDQPRMAAARRYAGAVDPFASGVYVNALGDEGEEGVQRAYGADKLARLAALKDRYDPENVLHLNHNIRPRKERPR